MAAKVSVLEVGTPGELDQAITSYVVQGFALANRTPTSATMVKRKEFSILWTVIGLVLCVLPLLIYLIIYATESDVVVEIRIRERQSEMEIVAEAKRLAQPERQFPSYEGHAERDREPRGGQ